MENCPRLDGIKPSRNPFCFKLPPCRRPLMSETCRTLLHILSNCSTGSELQPSQHKLDENGGVESANDSPSHGGLVNQHAEAKNKLVDSVHVDKDNRHAIWQEMGDITDAQMSGCIDLLDHIDHSREVDGEVPHENGANNGISGSLEDNGQESTLEFQLQNELGDKSNIPQSPVIQSDLANPQKMDTEIFIHEAYASIESLLMDTEFPQLVQSNEEKRYDADDSLLEDMEHGLQLKEIELQNLISSSGPANSSVSETAVEIEEGEISGDGGVSYESDSCMLEETVSLDQGFAHVSITTEKEFIHDVVDTEPQEKHVLTSFSNDPADGCSNMSKECIGKNSKEVEENDFQMVECKNDVETKVFGNVINSEIVTKQIEGVEKADRSSSCFLLKTITSENATETQGFVTETEVEEAHTMKKRKNRGPITEAGKAKRKAKKRIKRAEENRKLGVKRLKLHPVMKPKKVSYCFHYLNGRCHKGEECNYSHDTIPLTKSMPCGHFARNSCMKGDDCPYDHQLSKYPCNNIVSKGFCSRGTDCLFSHEVEATSESSKTPASTAQLKSPLLPSSSTPKMQVNAHGSSQPFPVKSKHQTEGKPIQRLGAKAPKGVSFLTNGNSPLVKDSDSENFNQRVIPSKSENTKKPNNVIKIPTETASIPRGINFLSFGRAPLTDSTPKTMPNLLIRDCRIGKFQFGEFCKGKEAGSSSPRSGDFCRFEMRSETPNKSTPRGISLLSFSKASSDGSSSKDQNISCSKERKITSHVASHQRQDSPSRINNSKNMQLNLLSSSLPFNQLFGQSTVGQSVGLPSSSFLANMPGSAQKALQTTLAFSAKFEPGIKLDQSMVPLP